MPPVTADESYDALLAASDELAAWSLSELNEADTRAKIIDHFLIDVLGWSEHQIRREQRTTDGEYLDYHLKSESNQFILEAKKAGAYFEMPAGRYRRARRGGVLSRSPSLHAALRQLVPYCTAKGVPAGAVSNGLQIAVTLPFIPSGVTYDTVLYDGLAQILANFTQVWNLLSPHGDCERVLREVALAPEYIRTPPSYSRRVLDDLHLPNETMARNPIDIALAPTLKRYFSELTGADRVDVLRNAYIETDRQASYGKQIDALLTDAVPRFDIPLIDVATTRSSAPSVDTRINEALQDAVEGSLLLLVGGVGAGKTTFVARYFEFLAGTSVRDAVIPIALDFTRTSEENANLSAFTDPGVLRQLEDGFPDYHLDSWETALRVYEREVTKLRRGDLAPFWANNKQRFDELVSEEIRKYKTDLSEHIRRLLVYLRTQHQKTICVIFDNVDQLNQEFQHRVIKLAHQKSKTWGCLSMLALREETYWRFRNTPPLDAYHRSAFHIAAPRIANVLSARLELAKKERGNQKLSVTSSDGVPFVDISTGQFLDILVASFLGEQDQNIFLLEALCANDIRQALDMFATFLLSGHTNTDEYIKSYAYGGSYVVPFHHLLRGVAFGERRNYDSSKSLIANVFVLAEDGFYSHFQQLRILRYLLVTRNMDSAPGRGFLTIASLFEVFRPLVAHEDGLRRVIDPLLRHRLIEAANGYRIHGDAADAVRITSAGEYYLNSLIFEFSYLDLIVSDTPIKSQQWYEKIIADAVKSGRPIDEFYARFRKVQSFLEYLADEETAETEYLSTLGLPEPVVAPLTAPLLDRFAASRISIEATAKRLGRDRPR